MFTLRGDSASRRVDHLSDEELASLDRDTRLPSDQRAIVNTEVLRRRTLTERRASGGVVLVGIQIPFWDMASFMVRWSIASIPAMLILVVIGAAAGALVGLVLAAIR